MPRIVALVGPRRGVLRELEARLLVGRAGEADLQLLDEKVSREHCLFERQADGIVVRDLGSRNGTWINGQRLERPARLQPGDQVGVGDTVLVYEPTFEPLRARDGSSTLLLTETAATGARSGKAAGAGVLERAGELALRAALAPSPEEAAALLVDAVQAALQPSAVALVACEGTGARRLLLSRPEAQPVSVARPLVELALRQRRPLAQPESQARAEEDGHTTRLRRRDGEVLCAPLVARGEPVAALCLVRETSFTEEEIALAGALAAAVGPAFAPAEERAKTRGLELPVAESRAMREAMRLAAAASKVPSTVLLTGESGTGKEELARAIHQLGPRAQGPFVAVNCGAIPAELAESELFGHEKGAFTGADRARPGVFEQADGGTLFLDEIGDLPLNLQVKLLRALQERVVTRVGGRSPLAVDVRVVAATHRDLPARVEKGEFRDDLYWRLNVLAIHLPPLRERPEDILPLAERFLARLAPQLGRRAQGFTQEARQALVSCAWPGNARQLANAVERALVLREEAGPIGLADLPAEVLAPARKGESAAAGRTLAELVRALEKEQVTLALKRARGVKTAAAEALGISRPTLDRKIEEFGIDLFGPA